MRSTVKKKARLATAAIAMAGAVATAAGSAYADPSGPPTPRALAGVGSDTTQGVMNAMAATVKDSSGNLVLGSYDAVGSATIQPQNGANCAIARPNGSGAGRTALVKALTPTDPTFGCLQWSRSSSLDITTPIPAGTPGITYVPFAIDAVTYVVTSTSSIPRTATLADLKGMYTCQPAYAGITAVLPQINSGTRKFWESTVGITDADIAAGKYPCVTDHINGHAVEEHNATLLQDNMVFPFSIAQYIAQSSNTIPDVRGTAVLGTIDGITPATLNGSFGVRREVYNVIPTPQTGTAPYSTVFVGPNSAICSNVAIIQQYGFATDPNCGSTTSHTP